MHFSSLPSWFHCRVCYYLQCSYSLSQKVKQRVKKNLVLSKFVSTSVLDQNSKSIREAPLKKLQGLFGRCQNGGGGGGGGSKRLPGWLGVGAPLPPLVNQVVIHLGNIEIRSYQGIYRADVKTERRKRLLQILCQKF